MSDFDLLTDQKAMVLTISIVQASAAGVLFMVSLWIHSPWTIPLGVALGANVYQWHALKKIWL